MAVSFFPKPEFTVEARLSWFQVVEQRNYFLTQAKAIAQLSCAVLNRFCGEAVLAPWVKAQVRGLWWQGTVYVKMSLQA